MLDNFISAIQSSRRHNSLYHFTDRRNLDSINRNGGILCMSAQRSQNIKCVAPGGNDWSFDADKRFGMDEYVHLCFMNDHPMEFTARRQGRIDQTSWLKIDPNVIRTPGTKVSFDVSNKSGIIPRDVKDAISHIDHEVIYHHTDWTDGAIKERLKSAKKCEILIPNMVPLKFILNPNG